MTQGPPAARSASAQTERARVAVGTIFLTNGVLFATWAVNIPGVRDHLGLSAAQIGAALLCFGLGSLASMPLTGGWIARWGSGPLTALLGPLTMLLLLLPFVLPGLGGLGLGQLGLWGLGAALALLGATNGALDVIMNAQGVTVERALGRPVLSRLHAYFSLGGVIGAALGTLLVGRVPMLAHVGLVVALTTLACLWAGRQLLPDAPTEAPTGAPTDAALAPAGSNAGPRRREGLQRSALLLGGLCFLGMLAEGANYDWATLYFRDVLGVSGGVSGLGYAAFVACMTLGRWFGDQWRGRYGDERLVRLGAALTVAGLGVALLLRWPLAAVLGFGLAGLGLSNVVPVMYGVAGHALAGRGIAQVATIGYGGFLLGPPLIGFVAQRAGLVAGLGLALGAAALVALLGGWVFGLVRVRPPAAMAQADPAPGAR